MRIYEEDKIPQAKIACFIFNLEVVVITFIRTQTATCSQCEDHSSGSSREAAEGSRAE